MVGQRPVAVYKITNSVNGKFYIGQSVAPGKRFIRHCAAGEQSGCHKLKAAIAKYGRDSFSMEVLWWCRDKPDANELEAFLIQETNSRTTGYNITPGGAGTGSGEDNPFFGRKHSPERIAQWSKTKRGKPMPPHVREAVRTANRGRRLSAKGKEALALGRALNRERNRDLLIARNKSREWSETSKAKLRKHNLGKVMPPESRNKIALANATRKWTSESRARLSAAKRKPLYCAELDVVFFSSIDAAEFLAVSPSAVQQAINLGTRVLKKYSFTRVTK